MAKTISCERVLAIVLNWLTLPLESWSTSYSYPYLHPSFINTYWTTL